MTYRVYLVEPHCWREFGIDYATRAAATAAADAYRWSFPSLRYVVRKCRLGRRKSQFIAQ